MIIQYYGTMNLDLAVVESAENFLAAYSRLYFSVISHFFSICLMVDNHSYRVKIYNYFHNQFRYNPYTRQEHSAFLHLP